MSSNHTDPHGLSVRERKFVHHYLKENNGTKAYKLAGYKINTPQAANSGASRLLRKSTVKQAIAAATAKLKDDSEVELKDLTGFLAKVIFTPIGKCDENSILLQSYTRTAGEISSTERKEMVNKLGAIKHLTFLLGYDPAQKTELSVPNDLHALLSNIRGNAE